MAQVEIPRNSDKVCELAETIIAKDAELGDASPLKILNWPEDSARIETIRAKGREAAELIRRAEELNEERKRELDVILPKIRRSRDILKGHYGQDLRKLGEFGFTVNY